MGPQTCGFELNQMKTTKINSIKLRDHVIYVMTLNTVSKRRVKLLDIARIVDQIGVL